uniref:Uncharacterized protein n=1 Tax=Cucumis melo TaxID=3656 RepID=A0A9I9E8F9_CUCME
MGKEVLALPFMCRISVENIPQSLRKAKSKKEEKRKRKKKATIPSKFQNAKPPFYINNKHRSITYYSLFPLLLPLSNLFNYTLNTQKPNHSKTL